uniref:Pentraxin family member n=1 Tax=Hadrurus spadix TaxID=141984 RepID=A0A1W7RAR3_9SCOR
MSSDKHFAVFLVVIFAFSCSAGEYTKIHFPPSTSSSFPRLRLENTLPTLREFSFCAWVRLYSLPGNYSTILSYAISRTDNELLFLLFNNTNKPVFRIYLGGIYKDVPCYPDWEVGTWRHICVSWFGANEIAKTYINGEPCEEVKVGYGNLNVPGGGVLIIGQEQDALDSKFDAHQAWHGDMTDIHLWDEVLCVEQIRDIGLCGEARKFREGNIINWKETPMAIFDGVIKSRSEHCFSKVI